MVSRLVKEDREVKDIDLGDDAYRQNWFEFSEQWATHAPFYFRERNSVGVICARHADVRYVFENPEMFSIVNGRAEFRRLAPYLGLKTLTSTEGPDHAKQRRIMMPPYSPASIAMLDVAAQTIIDDLLDRLADTGPGAKVDIRLEYAVPLLERLLLDEMFHLEPEDRTAFAEMNEARASLSLMKPGETDDADYSVKFARAKNLLSEVIKERTAHPGNDFISQLVTAEDDKRRLSFDQVLGSLFGMSSATLASTPSSISFAVMNLCRHPDQLRILLADPALGAIAMEECLRYHPPNYLTFPRFATRDTAIAGTHVEEGTIVQLSLTSANFDPLQFADPMAFDVRRDPKGIMSFGTGPHVCIAARLARSVMRRGVMSLIQRFPNIQLAQENFRPHYVGTVGELSPVSMPFTL
jgi:cytochrome P450